MESAPLFTDERMSTTDEKLDRLMESIDLLFARVGDLHHAQQQMQTHVDLNTRAVDQLAREQQ